MLLLCFSIAVPACSNIWFDVMFELSAAKSVSSRRPVAACVLVLMFCRLLYTWSRLFSLAPSDERTVETASMAFDRLSIWALALATPELLLPISSVPAVPGVRAAAAATSVAPPPLYRMLVAESAESNEPIWEERSTFIVSLLLEPIWKVMPPEAAKEPMLVPAAGAVALVPSAPDSSLVPPKVVLLMMLPSCLDRLSYSDCIAVWSSALAEPSAAWVAKSFMRLRMFEVSDRAPSAVCIIEMLFWVLRMATAMPLVCALRRVAICKPAASSADELMRRPVLRRVCEVDKDICVCEIAFSADKAALLV